MMDPRFRLKIVNMNAEDIGYLVLWCLIVARVNATLLLENVINQQRKMKTLIRLLTDA